MCIRWGSETSEKYKVSNGVRQGSILSPHLVKVYVDDLSIILKSQLIENWMLNHQHNHQLPHVRR